MRRTRLILVPMIVLAAASCGSDDRGSDADSSTGTEASAENGSTDLTDDQQAAVDQFMSQEDAGTVFDRECVEDKAADLSDDDAQAIADSGPDGNPQLSAEGEALTLELVSCLDNDALVEEFISGMEESGESFDEDCVREGLEGFDMGEVALAGAEGEMPEGLLSSLVECFDLDLGS